MLKIIGHVVLDNSFVVVVVFMIVEAFYLIVDHYVKLPVL